MPTFDDDDEWKRADAITGRRAPADDAAQKAFLRASAVPPSFDGRSAFVTWLRRVLADGAIDALRTERRPVPLDSVPDATDAWTDIAGNDADLGAAVAELAPDRRAPVVMRYWLDLTPTEIADDGRFIGQVECRLSRRAARSELVIVDEE